MGTFNFNKIYLTFMYYGDPNNQGVSIINFSPFFQAPRNYSGILDYYFWVLKKIEKNLKHYLVTNRAAYFFKRASAAWRKCLKLGGNFRVLRGKK